MNKMKRILLLLLAICLIFVAGCTQKETDTTDIQSDKQETTETIEIFTDDWIETQTATILSAGDIILHSPFISSRVYHQGNGVYNYNAMFKYIKGHYEAADFTVVNFESTISDSGYSGYPSFRSPAAIATAIKKSKVDMCLLANNHIYDNYDKGLRMTMDVMDKKSMLYIGTRQKVTDSTYMIREINGIKVGFFNYVYETGAADSQKSINAIHVSSESASLINTFHYDNLDAFYKEIKTGLREMRKAGVEYTIAYLHWGNEYQTQENATQRAMAQKLCELGIDALIGGHPHVVQPVDLLASEDGSHKMVCVYSMGNHLSNQRIEFMDSMPTGHTEDGLMVQLKLEKVGDGPVSLVEAEFIPTWVYHTTIHGGSEYFIMPLDDPDRIIEEASGLNISSDVEKSLDRTNAIIRKGVKKIKKALPVK